MWVDYRFTHGDYIDCPDCPGHGSKNRKPKLICSERNYSGCNVDVAYCEECGKGYEITYDVKNITRVTQWDQQTRQQREEEELKQHKREKEERRLKFEELKKEFGG